MRWMVSRAMDAVGPVPPLLTELDDVASDELIELWAEDVCWQVQLVDWSLRRPPWWRRRDRREWWRERSDLETIGQRLREDARATQRRGERGDPADG